MPDFIKTARANPDKLTIVGINMNDDPQEVKSFIGEQKIPYPITIDDTGDLVLKYRVPGHPHSVFINKAGVITGIIPGLASLPALEEQLAKALQ